MPKGFIPLEDCTLARSKLKKFAFTVQHDERRNFFIGCDSEADLYSWLQAMQVCVDAFDARRRALHQSLWASYVALHSKPRGSADEDGATRRRSLPSRASTSDDNISWRSVLALTGARALSDDEKNALVGAVACSRARRI
jgi:hypothetical protein